MSFTNLFNRVSRKRGEEYLAFRVQLKQAGLDTEEKAKTMLQKSRGRMLGLSAMVSVVTLLVSLFWPNLMGIFIVFGTLTLVWLLITIARGQLLIKQFIQQEFDGKR